MPDDGPSSLTALLAPIRSHWRVLAPLLAGVVFSCAFFVGAPAWNQNSRFALTRALVERASTQIDPDHVTTGDKSFRDGHFYSDKAPGISLLSTVPYAVLVGIRRVTAGDRPGVAVQSIDPRARELGAALEPEDRLPGDRLAYNQAHRFAQYVCTVVVVVVPSAVLGCGALFLLARRLWGRDDIARWLALTFALATPAWPYATALYGHQLCGCLLLAAFAGITLTQKPQRGVLLAVGSLLGWAVLTEYPAAVVVVLFVLLTALRHGPRAAAWVAVGGVPWALVLAGYHTAAFGSPLSTGYDFVYREEFARGMAVRYGLGLPDPTAALALLFGSFRGLFYLSPVLLLAVWGLASAVREPRSRTLAISALVVGVYFWLLNAGYYMWDGGAAAGPRHMVPALGFLVLGLGEAWRRVPRATAALTIWSAVQTTLLCAASPEVAQFGDPLWEFALGRVLESTPGPHASHTNLGLLLGLPSVLSLAPLCLAWAWAWATARARASATTPATDSPADATGSDQPRLDA